MDYYYLAEVLYYMINRPNGISIHPAYLFVFFMIGLALGFLSKVYFDKRVTKI